MNKFTIQHATQLMQSVADGQATLSADDAKAIIGLLEYQSNLVSSYAAVIGDMVIANRKTKKA